MDIVILQGERSMSSDNKTLGTFKLDGIRPAPRGTPQIEVTFDIDANGILNVSAKDKDTGKDQKITISGSSSMDETEVERLKQEAEKFADQDKEKMESVQNRNELDSLVYQSEKQIGELGEQLPEDLKSKINDLIGDAKVLEDQSSTSDAIKKAKDDLQKGLEDLMKVASASAGKTAGSPNAKPDVESEKAMDKDSQKEDIVDADFEVVDDEK